MLYLTYEYNRDVFLGNDWTPWIKKAFGEDVKFDGFGYGRREPTIMIPTTVFEKAKKEGKINQSNLIKIRGEFDVVEQLALGVRDFENDLRKDENGKWK